MSSKNSDDKKDKVSSPDFNREAINIQADIIPEINEYKEFCNKYQGISFDDLRTYELKKIYQNGIGLLEQYYIMGKKESTEIIMQLQYILNNITFTIMNKQADSIYLQNYSLNEKLEKNVKKAENLEKEANKKRQEIKYMKNDMKSIISTVVAIILTISIIPTAIAGIEHIDANYILPFISSIILFGMIMIVFIYSIYQEEIKQSTKKILIFVLGMTITFWIVCFKIDMGNNAEQNNTINIEQKIENNL